MSGCNAAPTSRPKLHRHSVQQACLHAHFFAPFSRMHSMTSSMNTFRSAGEPPTKILSPAAGLVAEREEAMGLLWLRQRRKGCSLCSLLHLRSG